MFPSIKLAMYFRDAPTLAPGRSRYRRNFRGPVIDRLAVDEDAAHVWRASPLEKLCKTLQLDPAINQTSKKQFEQRSRTFF